MNDSSFYSFPSCVSAVMFRLVEACQLYVSYLKSEHIVFLLSAMMSIKHVGLCLFLCFMWEKFFVRSFCGTSVISSRIFTLKHVSKPCLSFCGSYLSVTLNTQSYHLYSLVQRQITEFMNKWSKWISVCLQMTSVTAATDMKWCHITVSKTESFFFFHCCSLFIAAQWICWTTNTNPNTVLTRTQL